MSWILDPVHSSIDFAVRHMVVSTVKGRFAEFTVDAQIDVDDITGARGTVTVQTASVDTRDEQRDTHLRSADFFDAEKYRQMTFVVKDVRAAGSDYEIVGDLTIKDITREIVLATEVSGPVVDPFGLTRLGISATGKFDRKDFDLTWNVITEPGALLVGDDVKLSIEAEFTQA
jgi:polyisoprenoid-binding protein YceI